MPAFANFSRQLHGVSRDVACWRSGRSPSPGRRRRGQHDDAPRDAGSSPGMIKMLPAADAADV